MQSLLESESQNSQLQGSLRKEHTMADLINEAKFNDMFDKWWQGWIDIAPDTPVRERMIAEAAAHDFLNRGIKIGIQMEKDLRDS